MLIFGVGLSSSFAQNNTGTNSKKTKGDQTERKIKSKPKHLTDFDQSGFNLGVDAAINGTFIIHQQTYGLSRLMQYSPSIKFAAGILAGYNFNESEGVVIGFGYCGGGQNYHDFLDAVTYTKSVSMTYLQVPIMFKYIFSDETTQPYAMGGIQVGSLQSSSVVINDSTRYANTLPHKQGSASSTNFFQSNDLGFRLELGDDFLIADNVFLNAGIQAYYGLPDINNPDLRHSFTFHANTYPYKKSSNFITGIVIGIHYMFN